MKTPLIDTLKSLNHDRYHIPGHKGLTPDVFNDCFALDFTEINETGNLYEGTGPIIESEKEVAKYFGAHECIYLTGGSSQGIMTAIFTAKPKKMLCDRNSHKALCHALAFVDCDYDFINPSINQDFCVPSKILPEDVYEKLSQDREIDTLYITSPNYYGITSDIRAISSICTEFDVTLIVDAAHGFHFGAIGLESASMQGADFAISSAHKTTESLGQGACLLVRKPSLARKNASIFGTSSPSYLIMSSIEYAVDNIHKYADFTTLATDLKSKISKNTKFSVLNSNDSCRLVVNTKNTNISGHKLAEILENEHKIVPEMADFYNVVFVLTYNDVNLDKLFLSLQKISDFCEATNTPKLHINAQDYSRKISIRQAMFSDFEHQKLSECAGKISAEMICPYPPGVPIVYPGEIILQNHIEYIENLCYNYKEYVNIIKF